MGLDTVLDYILLKLQKNPKFFNDITLSENEAIITLFDDFSNNEENSQK